VLVIEGNKQSGAMITAEKAISQGREVFALPGKINESNSEGPNDLIQRGVNIALSAHDIVTHFDLLYHGTVDFTSLYFAKRHSELELSALEKYGVSTDVCFGELSCGAAPVAKNKAPMERSIKEASVESVQNRPDEETEARPRGADNSSALLNSLDGITKKVFEAMPIDKAISPDEFVASGISISEAITSLTMLEIMGLVSSLPGGTYIRK
jgi:DNA processing protein